MFIYTQCPELDPIPCPTCGGMGWRDIGDCEDGVIDVCPGCEGTGEDTYDDD